MRIATLACLLAGFAGPGKSASAAEPSRLLLGGAQVSSGNTYAYLGQVMNLSATTLGNGVALRLWADWSQYRYDKDGLTHEVEAPGAQAMLGYQGSDADYWWGLYGGATFRHSSISPDDPSSPVRGSKLRPMLQLEGERTLQQAWKLGAGGSYVLEQDAYWARVRVSRRIGASGPQLGAEAITQGDRDYRAHQYGLVLAGMKAGQTLEIGLRLGTRQVEGLDSQTYFGVELGGLY